LCQTHRLEIHSGVLAEVLRATGGKVQVPSRTSPDKAKAAFIQHAEALFAQGQETVGAWNFLDLAKRHGRSRSWVYYCLGEMVREDLLERDGYLYRKTTRSEEG
jgi:hypothetical protein